MSTPLIINRKNLTIWCRDDCHATCQQQRGRHGLAFGPQPRKLNVIFACPCECHQEWQGTEVASLYRPHERNGSSSQKFQVGGTE